MNIFKTALSSLTRPEKIIIAGAGLVFLTGTFFWLGLFLDKKTDRVPVAGGELREGVVGQPIYVNPIITDNDPDRDISAIVYADLAKLAKDISLEKNKNSYVVNLKDDIFWSDGEKITSDDVIFTVRTIQDANARSPLFQTWQGVVAERVSELQLRFILRTPYVFFEKNLARLPVIPQHIFSNIPPANLRLSNYNLEPVASGPYKFAGYEKRKDGFITEYRLEINPRWSGKTPFLERIAFKFYENEGDLVSAFNLRTVDGFGGLDPKKIGSLSSSRKIAELTLPRYYAVFFNQSINPILKEEKIRRALIQAVNKEKITKEVFNGNVLIADGPLLPGLEGYEPPTGEKIGYNPEAAKENLADFREKNLEFNLVVPQVDFLVKTAELIKTDWEVIGVKTNLAVLNPSDIAGEVIRTRNYEMLLFGSIISNNPDVFSFWHSSERFYPGLNLGLYSNKAVDEILEKIRQDPAPEERKENLSRLQRLIAGDAPALFLYSPKYLYVSAPALGGLEEKLITTPADRFQNIEEWYKKTAKIFKR